MKKRRNARRRRGEGTIDLLPDGRWQGRLSYVDGSGKRCRPVFYGKTQTEVLEQLDEHRVKARKGQVSQAGQLTVGDYLDQWLEEKQGTVAPRTLIPYRDHVRLYLKPHMGRVKLAKLDQGHVKRLHTSLTADGISNAMQHKAATTLRTALKAAVKADLIPANPAADVKKPHVESKEMGVFDKAQARRFLDAAKADRLNALYVVWLASMAREGELFALLWADVDFTGKGISVTKSLEDLRGKLRPKNVKTKKGKRTIPLPPFAMATLEEHRTAMIEEGNYGPREPVFCAPMGGYLRQSNVRNRSFRKVIRAADAKEEEDARREGRAPDPLPYVTPYSLRHTGATLLLVAGVNVKVVSERLGHSNAIQTLNTYCHVLPGMQEAAADKMQDLLG